MQRARLEKLAAVAVLGLALVLLAAGSVFHHKVYDTDTEEYGIASFIKLGDRDLVVDTTFGGVTRKAERLYSTYDRSEPHGKRSCPT